MDNLSRCKEDNAIVDLDDHMAVKNHYGHTLMQPVQMNWFERLIWRKRIKKQK